MNLRLLPVILAACLLAACAHSNNAVSHGSGSRQIDFDALASNAKQDLAPRTLPNGKLYCMELARTEKSQDSCGGDLEDTLLGSETDKAVGLANLLKGIERIRLSINPCRFWQLGCQSRARKLDRQSSPTNGN